MYRSGGALRVLHVRRLADLLPLPRNRRFLHPEIRDHRLVRQCLHPHHHHRPLPRGHHCSHGEEQSSRDSRVSHGIEYPIHWL